MGMILDGAGCFNRLHVRGGVKLDEAEDGRPVAAARIEVDIVVAAARGRDERDGVGRWCGGGLDGLCHGEREERIGFGVDQEQGTGQPARKVVAVGQQSGTRRARSGETICPAASRNEVKGWQSMMPSGAGARSLAQSARTPVPSEKPSTKMGVPVGTSVWR